MSRILAIVALIALTLAAMAVSFPAASALADSPTDCPKGNTYCEYPGKCGSYVDLNKDGYCDLSVPEEPRASALPAAPAGGDVKVSNPSATIQSTSVVSPHAGTLSPAPTKDPAPSASSYSKAPAILSSRYNLLVIAFVTLAVYAVSYVLARRRVFPLKAHRKIWNWVLLVSTFFTFLMGLLLTLEIDLRFNAGIPLNIIYWHVEIGIVMCVIGALHAIWHWRYFGKLRNGNGNGC